MRKLIILALALAVSVPAVFNAQNSSKSTNMLTAVIKTSAGDIELELHGKEAPLTVANFVNLARRGYYDGVQFHRVIANFMIQGGDPTGTGRGGPGYKFEDEFVPSLRHSTPGILSMANAGKATNGSQFFITHVPTPHLDNAHTVFGRVLKGQDVVDSIKQGDKIVSVTISGDMPEEVKSKQARVDEWNKVIDGKFPDLKAAEKL